MLSISPTASSLSTPISSNSTAVLPCRLSATWSHTPRNWRLCLAQASITRTKLFSTTATSAAETSCAPLLSPESLASRTPASFCSCSILARSSSRLSVELAACSSAAGGVGEEAG